MMERSPRAPVFAFSADSAQINQQWSWRSVFRQGGTGATTTQTAMNGPEARSAWADECELRSSWQWIFVDLGRAASPPFARIHSKLPR
jgi:hypothetical protein